jgi:nucleoside-diphosphate-sugar epimerase
MVSINQLVDIVAAISDQKVIKKHIDGPQGVRGRNSDNTRLKSVLGWEPALSLEEGLARTYAWIEAQVKEKYFRSKKDVSAVTASAA